MIRPFVGKPGWYVAPIDMVRPIFGASGILLQGATCRIHQTHLPLLNNDEAQRLLSVTNNVPEVWAQRDVATEALGFKLRTTQQTGIDFIHARRGIRGTLLGDDMRVGKTLTALMAHQPDSGPLVVTAPLQARGVWLGWMRRVWPEHADNIGVVTGRKFNPDVLKHPLVFMHYDVIKDWQTPLDIGTLIFDEAHFLTNHKSKRTNAAIFHAMRAQRVIAMTGTPIWNLPSDLWAVLGLVAPGGFGGFRDFCMRYGLPVQTGYGVQYTGLSNEVELKARMSEIMLRRRWVDVADDIPPITRSVIVASVDDVTRRKLDILSAKLKSERTNTAGNLAHYRSQLALLKVPTIVAETNKALDAGEPIVVWTWHKETAERVKEKLGDRAVMIHGDIPAVTREERIAHWKEQCGAGNPMALVANMAVAQVAVDFSVARLALFGEIDYTPAVIGQAEMRTFSPLRGMDVTFVVADHIVDQRIIRSLVSKLGAANPLGVGAAVDAIDALRSAALGTQEEADLDRLLEDMLAA